MEIRQQNIENIAALIQKGEKHSNDLKIGLELEHFVIDKKTGISMDCEGAHGICGFLPKISPYFNEDIYIDGLLMGMKREDCSLTLEPAAQMEVSINPYDSLEQIHQVYLKFEKDINEVLIKENLKLATLGYHPVSKIDELRMIPKSRYRYMSEYLPTKGQYALNMMKGTASTQVVIDYTDEDDFIAKYRLSNCLGPLFYFLTDNAPIFEGEPYHGRMIRGQIWDEVDPARSGLTTGSLDHPFGYREYAAYIYDNPSVLTLIDDEIIYTKETPLSEIFRERIMTIQEIEYAMSMFFPDSRVRTYIEIRMADSMPITYALAYAALIKGIFYNAEHLQKYNAFFSQADTAAIKAWKKDLIQDGYQAVLYGKDTKTLLLEMMQDAKNVLSADETIFIEPLKDMIIKEQAIWQTKEIRELLSVRKDTDLIYNI